MRRFAIFFLAFCAPLAVIAAGAQGADDPFRPAEKFSEGIVGRFEAANSFIAAPVTLSSQFTAATAERPAVLAIAARIAPGQHTYSMTQRPGGPNPTRIELAPSSDYRLLGAWRAYPEPNKRIEQGPIWTGLEIQEHEGEVTWYAPVELIAGADAEALEIRGNVYMDVCEKGGYCIPVEEEFSARLAERPASELPLADEFSQSALNNAQAATGSFQPKSSAVKFQGQLVPATVRPGESAQIELTATLPRGGRVYALADRDDRVGTKPMLIAIQRASGLVPHRATTDAALKIDNSVPQFGEMKYHEGTVTWTLLLDVPREAPPGEYPITGLFGYQACEYGGDGQNICELPQAVQFAATLHVGEEASESAAPLTFAPTKNYPQVATAAATFADYLDRQSGADPPRRGGADSTALAELATPTIRSADQYDLSLIQLTSTSRSYATYIMLALLGGLILNLMPCVLPVIGLKVMSFVEQAHHSRARALVLNLWYAAGIVSVFLLLALLAALPQLGLGKEGLGWGGQFGSTAFNATLAAIVFAMALSLLGVWEVPIPGFFGTGSIQAAAAKEGPLGAFLKGVVTTVLATPCTAPFMATAIAWAVTQPPGTTFVVFSSLGVGMASPYLVVGVFPELLRFMPKPGAWMETFKQVSGFVLLATVVFILSFIEPAAVIPTIVLLLGIGLACWLVARTPLTAEFGRRVRAWAVAGAVVLAFVGISFGLLRLNDGPTWQPFSLERLKEVAVDEGQTVIVEFTADWCINCKFLAQTVLHTTPVERAIARSGVVTMKADYTHYPPEIDRTLKALGANGVPVIAIFPGHAPYDPIVFRGGYTQQGLLTALDQATSRRSRPGSPSIAEASAVAAPVN